MTCFWRYLKPSIVHGSKRPPFQLNGRLETQIWKAPAGKPILHRSARLKGRFTLNISYLNNSTGQDDTDKEKEQANTFQSWTAHVHLPEHSHISPLRQLLTQWEVWRRGTCSTTRRVLCVLVWFWLYGCWHFEHIPASQTLWHNHNATHIVLFS